MVGVALVDRQEVEGGKVKKASRQFHQRGGATGSFG